ncbi:hypothetical protein ACWGIU_07020 [Streptomyces sp. NPDC054840]
MRRWPLPLLLAAPGCVTIHPAPAPPAGIPATAPADDKHPSVSPAVRNGTALPLSPLPEPAPPAPAGPAPEQEHAPGPGHPAAKDRSSTRETRSTTPEHRRTARPAPAPPRRATAPKRAMPPAAKPKARPKTKARPKAPVPHRPVRPAPATGAGDMRELCRAAHGVTSPAITSLCQQTYR